MNETVLSPIHHNEIELSLVGKMFRGESTFNSSHIFVIIVINVYYMTLLIVSISYNLEKVTKLELEIYRLNFHQVDLLRRNKNLTAKNEELE